MKMYSSALEKLLTRSPTHSSRRNHARKFLYSALALSALISATAFSDEWRPRHALVPPTGVLNLTQPGGPADVLLPGPENPAAADAWRTQMKAWREERLQRLRYQGAEYERPELAWTQHVYSQVQVLIWERDFLRSQRARIHRRPLSRRSARPHRPDRRGADLAAVPPIWASTTATNSTCSATCPAASPRSAG